MTVHSTPAGPCGSRTATYWLRPSVQAVLARRRAGEVASPPAVIDGAWLCELCLAAGADDVAAVSLGHADLAGQRGSM